MSNYKRKSINSGPVKFKLINAGIGKDSKLTKFRITIDAKAHSKIQYENDDEISKNDKTIGNSNQPNESKYINEDGNTVTKYKSADSTNLQPASKKELLDKLNTSSRYFRLDYALLILTFLIPLFFHSTITALEFKIVFACGITLAIVAAIWEYRSRTIILNFYFEDDAASTFEYIVKAFNELANNSIVWLQQESTNLWDLKDQKRNAGAKDLVDLSKANLGEGSPIWVKKNLSIPGITTRFQSYYFLPDGILIYDKTGFGHVAYNELTIETDIVRFITASPPKDSRVIDKTWLHPNASGGPDRRFSENHEIPICSFGELKIKSNTGMYLYLMTSKESSPEMFHHKFNEVIKKIKGRK